MRTSTSDPAKLRALVDREAEAAGFDAVAVTTPDAIPQAPARLAAFVEAGFHGSMGWIAETLERRSSPSTLWPEVRSIIVLAMNYAPDHDPRDILARKASGAISVYARNRDYHDVMKGRLKEIAGKIVARAGGDVKVFVDTAPVMEKPLAGAAGLGWQGKHTVLVSREHGDWLFLGAILTTAALAPDAEEVSRCGSCTRCLDICPTKAFPAPYQLDARRCLAYLSIEHKGHIPLEFREPMGNRVFGCDDCLAVCPWNKFASAATEIRFAAQPATDNPPLADLLALDDAAFRQRFAGTPVKRTGRNRIVRNTLIAAGNSGDRSLLRLITPLFEDESPLVRAMAIWSAKRLMHEEEFAPFKSRYEAREADPEVAREWAQPVEGHSA